MERNDNLNIDIIGDVSTRRGVYANTTFITSREEQDIIDFVFADVVDAGGRISGVLATRVIMSRQSLLRLRDTINAHIEAINNERI